jgi:hypothetical protein
LTAEGGLLEISQPMETIHGAPSYTLKTAEVELAVTQTAGHLAPVTFNLAGLKASPYSLSPWTPTQIDQSLPNLLTYLRGDFMCLPFGGQEKGPPHGDTANAPWQLAASTATSLKLTQTGTDTGATVAKNFTLIPGHHAIYWEHLIENLEGRWNYGNHPVLDLSHVPAGAARIATSPFRFGSVYAGEFSNPAAGETGVLKPFAEFTTLKSVPMKDGTQTDLTHYPARAGSDDLIMLVNEPATEAQPFAWTAVTFPGYVWFSLKHVADFPSTLFWLSNGGRPGHPWEKRHLGRLGLEEVCSHFCDGVDIAREDRLATKGIPTSRLFRKDERVRLPLIQAAAAVPAAFGQVQSIVPAGPEAVRITGEHGQAITVPINWQFLKS